MRPRSRCKTVGAIFGQHNPGDQSRLTPLATHRIASWCSAARSARHLPPPLLVFCRAQRSSRRPQPLLVSCRAQRLDGTRAPKCRVARGRMDQALDGVLDAVRQLLEPGAPDLNLEGLLPQTCGAISMVLGDDEPQLDPGVDVGAPVLVQAPPGHRVDPRLGQDPGVAPEELDRRRGAALTNMLRGLEVRPPPPHPPPPSPRLCGGSPCQRWKPFHLFPRLTVPSLAQDLESVCGAGPNPAKCCSAVCVLGLLLDSTPRLRSLHAHARAYESLSSRNAREGAAVPTTGVEYFKRETLKRPAPDREPDAAPGGVGVTSSLLPGPAEDDGSSYEHDVLDCIKATCSNASDLTAARESFVLDGVRELLGQGCCMASVYAVLCVSRNYLHYTPEGKSEPRIRRAGVREDGDSLTAQLSMVSVEDLSLLDLETNSPCTCCRQDVASSVRCLSRPFSPLNLLEMRLRYISSAHSPRTQRAQLVSHLWQTLTGRPSTVSLAWLADLFGASEQRLLAVQRACALATRRGDVALRSVIAHRRLAPPSAGGNLLRDRAAVWETLNLLTRCEPDGKRIARWTTPDVSSLRKAFVWHLAKHGEDSCLWTTFMRRASEWLEEMGMLKCAPVYKDHNVCDACTDLASTTRGCAVEAASVGIVADGKRCTGFVPGAFLPSAVADPASLSTDDASRARDQLLRLGKLAAAALKDHCSRDHRTRVWHAELVCFELM